MNPFYFYSYSLCVYLCKAVKYLVCSSKWRVKLSVKGCIFSCSRENYIFSISFLIFWNSINLAYISQLGSKNLMSDYTFTSQRESHSVPDMGFFANFNYFVPFGVIEIRYIKIHFNYFNGNSDNSSWSGWWIRFLYAPPHKGLPFWKKIWASLSFSYSLKITYILIRQVIFLKKMAVLLVKLTILISWSPIPFNPFININEIGKYHSHNIM